jgi:hypothetical protein
MAVCVSASYNLSTGVRIAVQSDIRPFGPVRVDLMTSIMGDEKHVYFGVFRLESYEHWQQTHGIRDLKNEAFWKPYGQEPLISPPLQRNTSISVKDLLNPEAPQHQPQQAISRCPEHESQVSRPSRIIIPYPSGMTARTSCDKIRR